MGAVNSTAFAGEAAAQAAEEARIAEAKRLEEEEAAAQAAEEARIAEAKRLEVDVPRKRKRPLFVLRKSSRKKQKIMPDCEVPLLQQVLYFWTKDTILSAKWMKAISDSSDVFPALTRDMFTAGNLQLFVKIAMQRVLHVRDNSPLSFAEEIENLRVAVRCMRTVGSRTSSRKGTKICLGTGILFFCMKCAYKTYKSSLARGMEDEETRCLLMICLSAYEVAGHLLMKSFGLSLLLQRSEGNSGELMVRSEASMKIGANDEIAQIVPRTLCNIFPIPTSTFPYSDTSSSSPIEILPGDQIRIAEHTVVGSLHVSKMLADLFLNNLEKGRNNANGLGDATAEFGNQFHYMVQCSLSVDLENPSFLRILRSVTMPWILSFVMTKDANQDEEGYCAVTTKVAMSSLICVHERLWHWAFRVDQHCSSMKKMTKESNIENANLGSLGQLSLNLRRDSVMVLLLCSNYEGKWTMPFDSLFSAVRTVPPKWTLSGLVERMENKLADGRLNKAALGLMHDAVGVAFDDMSRGSASFPAPPVSLHVEPNVAGSDDKTALPPKHPASSNFTRAQILFRLGHDALQEARQNGELCALWRNHSVVAGCARHPPSRHVAQFTQVLRARKLLFYAASFAGPASSQLSRGIMRSLALVVGPEGREESNTNIGISAAVLVHTSIGSSERQKVSQAYASSIARCNGFDMRSVFNAFDAPVGNREARNAAIEHVFQVGQSIIPNGWNFVAMARCSTGEILVSSLMPLPVKDDKGGFSTRTVCIFPEREELSDNACDASSSKMLCSFDALMKRNRKSLINVDVDRKDFRKDNEKASWWRERFCINDELEALLEQIDHLYFESKPVKELLLCCSNDEDRASRSTGNEYSGAPKASKERKASKEQCTFLVLDERLHPVPWEGTKSLCGTTVCRLPSLPFAIATLIEAGKSKGTMPCVDPARVSFILDPESNLGEMRATLCPLINELSGQYEWGWNGIVGTLPSPSFTETALTRTDGLLLHCGHGGGENCISSSALESFLAVKPLSPSTEGPFSTVSRQCLSSVVLMGCSSAELNHYYSSSAQERNGPLDDEVIATELKGTALSYLYAGAPCVVGNLWDVSDKDINRYTVELLQSFLGSEESRMDASLAKCVAVSRKACKLSFIIGCAPVVYGVPVWLK